MYAQSDEIAALLQMQQVDLEILHAKKELEELPERGIILNVRKKKQAAEGKRAQIDELRAKTDAKLARIAKEDASLAKKQERVQSEIDALRGDYRSVEARSKELNGYAKRRNTLEGELNAISDELAKIDAIQARVAQVISNLDAQEASATKVFVDKGGALKERIAQLDSRHSKFVQLLPEEVKEAYQKIANRTGGVAVARLQGLSCGACRANIEQGRLAEMSAQGNIGHCPHCGRLLVLE